MIWLGAGQEGSVYRIGNRVEKHFRPGKLETPDVRRLETALARSGPWIPSATWHYTGDHWIASYDWFDSEPVEKIRLEEAAAFLEFSQKQRFVCLNIKFENFRRRRDGHLVFIDLSRDIRPMHVSFFRDAAARLYCLAELGWSDDDMKRDAWTLREDGGYQSLPGFAEFYRTSLERQHRRAWGPYATKPRAGAESSASQVTLLIKSCAMDAPYLLPHLRHIVRRLETPQRFNEVVLLIDPFRGPFLRQHSPGDFLGVVQAAARALDEGLVGRVLIAPESQDVNGEINKRWFSIVAEGTHNRQGVPVSSQLWGFEQIGTRYVLQCDADVLIGRSDPKHDYLADMMEAIQQTDVFSVGFNIPQQANAQFRRYDAEPGGYVPEVRCGLLDLERIFAARPLPNMADGERPVLSWYRSLEQLQHETGRRSLRGGDPRTWYIHPPNSWKVSPRVFEEVLCRVEAGQLPDIQRGAWDVTGDPKDWAIPKRSESIVFLIKGRNTAREKIARCAASLAMQEDQDFGLVVIDDASTTEHAPFLADEFRHFSNRASILRRSRRVGRMPNFITGVSEICVRPDTLVVVLDMDDALFDSFVVGRLREHMAEGHDVMLGAMFRPDKPLKLYEPNFIDPRARWGGDVWIHLRAFHKSLFDAVPHDDWRIDGQWIPHCTDYATMIPIVERSRKPAYIPEYLYFHERSTPKTPALQSQKDAIIRAILAKLPHARVGL